MTVKGEILQVLTKTEKPPLPTTEKINQHYKKDYYLNNAVERGKGRFAKRFSGERPFRSAFKLLF